MFSNFNKMLSWVIVLSVLLVVPVAADAGFTDDLKKAGQQAQDDFKQLGKDLKNATSGVKKDATKLPGGVTYRLKKIGKELDKAEKALTRGRPAERNLVAAKRYRKEIDKQYAGKFAPDHPDIKAVDDRIAKVSASAGQAEKDKAAHKAAADKARAADTEKKKAVEVQKQKAAADQKEKELQSKASVRANCDEMNKRLRVFTEGPKPLHTYATDDAQLMNKWKGYYDEAKSELDQMQVPAGQCPGLDGTKKTLDRYMKNFETYYDTYQKKNAAASAVLGSIVFSKKPINPSNPQNITTEFNTGDYIYALITTKKSFQEITGKDWIRIDVDIDGKKIHAQFIKLHNPSDRTGKTLLFEIAPAPDKMTAYGNPDIEYGTSKANLRQGPQEMTLHLSKLGGGKHKATFRIGSYGKIYAKGGFSIQGDGFKFYADLHEKAKSAMLKSVTLPRAKMNNPGLEKEMKALLEKEGWKVLRMNIVDKDWWIDRMSGGDSPVKSRHMDAAVLSKDGQGYFYKKVRFHQDKLITGAFGDIYISSTGGRIAIPDENIDK